MNKIISVSLSLSIVLIAQNDFQKSFDVSTFVGKNYFSSSSGLEDDYAIGIKANRYINNNVSLGLEYMKISDTNYKDYNFNTDIKRYGINGNYELKYKDIVPYATLGLGHEDVSNYLDNSFQNKNLPSNYIKSAVGAKYFIDDNFNIGAEVANYYKFKTHRNDILATVGIGYVFGKSEQTHQEPKQLKTQPKPEAKSIMVEPLIVESAIVKPIVKEEVSNTKVEVQIEKIFNLNINFDYDLDDIKAIYLEKIDQLIAVLKSYPNAKVEVIGHTDNVATQKYNLKLGQKRADKFVNILTTNGIDSNRITTSSKGELNPLVSNNTEDNRAKNRRVEVKISY
jgi:outer membrane protein OmpA-like peptidoglycan-associated protein